MRDSYKLITTLPFDGLGLDFIEGPKNKDIVLENGLPDSLTLFAGVINGKNIWRY